MNNSSLMDAAWVALKEQTKFFEGKYEGISFVDTKKERFCEEYKNIYEEFKKNYMGQTSSEERNELDPHKQAAILVISSLKVGAVQHKVNEGEISILPQLVAINVALSFMNDELNKRLEEKNICVTIKQYKLPIAIACDTPYAEVMARILYREQYNDEIKDIVKANFNLLELAENFYLLEYINLLQYGIEPELLRDEKTDPIS